MTAVNRPPSRRPRNRKALILAAAIDCFQRSGYQATEMKDIAAAVGITAAALYHHFRSKQELLGAALLDSSDHLWRTVAAAEAEGLESLLRLLTSFSLDHRSYSIVWYREIRHLSSEHRDEVRQRQQRISGTLGKALQSSRPDLGPTETALISWAVMAALGSPSYHRIELPRPRFEELLLGLGRAMTQVRLSPTDAPAPRTGPRLRPVSRREALLTAAVTLFTERGYQAVSMEDVGAAVGVSRLSVYNYFPSKADLLSAVLHRVSEEKWATLNRSLAQSETEEEALRRIVRSYAESTVLDRGSGAMLLVSELAHIPSADRDALLRLQVDYVAEWVALFLGCRPTLSQSEAGILVNAVLVMLSVLPRLPLLSQRDDLAGPLAELALTILDVPAPS
ncbi:TetR/AcrR family transcriptional regulator [Streptomyces pristinaespiralis]|uniref:TetR family transcriptional regulator n=1 Tax=Streptomyces pristinaespiralis TaxID=38300 RepID=A0A0M3QH05_STRPR|nr:TetR family transcriptional regulator [Streptomyces pristinaespiralis]ALC18713.1 TetR family transcriptional regulator [Streptomyces pristinaespiralis]QMU18124.1 TetR family transcriptional regulator [Streptomyces pristinaespiralis]